MELVAPTPQRPIVVFGEAMIELSGVDGGTCRLGVAGDTFNTAIHLARAGLPVSYATCIGGDPFSHRISAALEDEGVGRDLVLHHETRVAGLYGISLDAHGERSFIYWRGESAARAFFDAPGADKVIDAIKTAPLVYFSGITLSLFSKAHHDVLAEAIDATRRRGGVVAFDTNYRPRGWRSPDDARTAIGKIARHVSVALPTFEDDAALFGDTTAEDAAARWSRWGVQEVVVKQGPSGAYVAGVGWIPPASRLAPVDTTGAGDAFNGAYLAARLRGAEPADATRAGHDLAGRALMTHGAMSPRDPVEQ